MQPTGIDLSGYTFAVVLEGYNWQTDSWEQYVYQAGNGEEGLIQAGAMRDEIQRSQDSQETPSARDIHIEYAPLVQWARWIDGDD